MRKLLLAGIASLVFMSGAGAALADYSAIAVGVGGWGWAKHYSSMEGARAAAVRQCRQQGGSCSISTAEQSSWWYSAGYCDGHPYSAASPQGAWRAEELVFWKGQQDGYYDCEIVGTIYGR